MDGVYMEREVLEQILDGSTKPTDLPLSLLKDMTKSFSEQLKIGQGGFGTVYKGFLGSRTVAVKRIANNHTFDNDEKQFRREVNNLIGVDQQNVVRFLGFCSNTEHTLMPFEGKQVYAERRERLLCFEYIGNGSLGKYINDELRGLEWKTRFGIIKGICEGLHYLHEEKGMIHMDLKPDNILLDENMTPKITDFGLSRLENSQTTCTDRFFTVGYCAPEYQFHGKMSSKSDIYSLGVIIVELVNGKKDISDINNVLRRWRHRWNKSGEGTALEYHQVTKCLELGKRCQDDKDTGRPSISDIMGHLREMNCWDKHVISDDKSITGQMKPSYSEDDMLHIEPLELRFHVQLNKEMSCPLDLTNETDSYIAFDIAQMMRPLRYRTQPEKGIVPPRSKSSVTIILQALDKVLNDMQQDGVFVVRSTQVNGGLPIDDITEEISKKEKAGCMVDEVALDVVIEVETIEVHPHELRFPFILSERMTFSISIKLVNSSEDYMAFHPRYGVENAADYFTHPAGAVVAPKSTQELLVRRTAKKGVPQSKECIDKYIIYSTAVSMDFKTDDLEKFYQETSEDRKWHEMELDVVLEEASKVCLSTPRELIQVKPDELRLLFKPNEEEHSTVMLVNITEATVAIITMIKSDNVAPYKTRPLKGIIPPYSTLELVVTREPMEEGAVQDLQCDDKCYVYSTVVSQDFMTSHLRDDFYETEVGRIWYRADLGIVHVRPSRSRHSECIAGTSFVQTIDMHPTEPWILMTRPNGKSVYIWDYETKEMTEVPVRKSLDGAVTKAKFMARKNLILAGDDHGHVYVYRFDPKGEVRYFHKNIKKLRDLKEHSREISSLAIQLTGPYVLSVSGDGKVVQWDSEERFRRFLLATYLSSWDVKQKYRMYGDPSHVAFNPKDAKSFAINHHEKIQIWNIKSSKCTAEFVGHSSHINCFDYFSHGDELYMITGSRDRTAKIWNYKTGACVQTLRGHTDAVQTACYHPDPSQLITSSQDGFIYLWNSTTFRLERVLNFDLGAVYAIGCLRLSTRIAIAHEGGLVLADILP